MIPEHIKDLKKHQLSHLLMLIVRPAFLLFILACVGMIVLSCLDFLTYARINTYEFIPFTPIWTTDNFTMILDRFGFSMEGWLQLRLASSLLTAVVFAVVGILIFVKKSADPFGLYVAAVFILFGTVGGGLLTAFMGIHLEFKTLLTPFGVLAWFSFFVLLFLFPTGHFVPRWSIWVTLALLVVYLIDILGYGANTPPTPLVAAILAGLAIGAGSQVYRFRRVSRPIERQQTKLVMAAMVLAAAILILSILPMAIPALLIPGTPANAVALFASWLPNIFSTIIPLAVAFAILRYHLWDIDLIIRRTLQYTLLMVLLAAIYLSGVLLLQQVFQSLTGQGSDLALVLTTLMIAALFQPLRLRIQKWIDRRFYRNKYDTQEALESYASLARNDIGLDQFTGELIQLAQQTVQPKGISLWISSGKKEEER